jgi:Flp pilus assembly pilin Flp
MKKNFRGQGLVEYAILIALIAIGIALALKLYGISVYDTYCYAAAKISGSEACKPVQLCQDDFSTDLAGWTSVQGSKGSIAGGKFCPPNYTLMLGMNGYVFQYDPGYSPGSFIIRKWVNGRELSVPIAVAKASGYDWYNTPRDIQVVVKGDTFTAYVDGTPVLTATDSTYTSGGTGIRTWDSTQVCFDQFGMQSAP